MVYYCVVLLLCCHLAIIKAARVDWLVHDIRGTANFVRVDWLVHDIRGMANFVRLACTVPAVAVHFFLFSILFRFCYSYSYLLIIYS